MSDGMLWDQQTDQGESARAFAAFVVYRDLGPDRSLDKAFAAARGNQPGIKTVPGYWRQWCVTYRWVDRAAAYDAAMRAKEQAAREAAQAAEAQAWARKRAEEAAVEWDLSRALIEKARAMLAFPLQTQVVTHDGKQVTIHPARWTFRDITAAVETASKLARLAAGMETSRDLLRVIDVTADDLAAARQRALEYEQKLLAGDSQ